MPLINNIEIIQQRAKLYNSACNCGVYVVLRGHGLDQDGSQLLFTVGICGRTRLEIADGGSRWSLMTFCTKLRKWSAGW